MSEYQGIESPPPVPPYAAGDRIYDYADGREYIVNRCISVEIRDRWFVEFDLADKRSHWMLVTPNGYSPNRRFGPEPISPDPFAWFGDDIGPSE